MDPVEALATVPFLAAATPGALSRLAQHSTWRHLSRGEFLFHVGEPATQLYVLASGRVAAAATSPHGTPLLFHVASVGEAPGALDLLHGGSYTASAQALSLVTALAVPARPCLDLLKAEPAALLLFAQDLAEIARILTESLADLVFLDLERRLARTLIEAPTVDDYVTLTETQGEWAARLGVARQSLNQAFRKLASRRLIVIESPRVMRILDREAMSAFIASLPR